MAVSEGYRAFIMERLSSCVPDLRSRRMFGGVGIYSGERFFALISEDVLYFKVDDQTRSQYESTGANPFRPYGDDRGMSYYTVPADVLEHADRLAEWSAEALDVAHRAASKRRA